MAATRSTGRTGNSTSKKTDKKASSSSKAASTKKPAKKTDSRHGRVAKASKKPALKGKGRISNPIDDIESDSSPDPGSDDFESDSSPDPGSDDFESEDSEPTQAQIRALIDDRDEKVRSYRANRAREMRDREFRDSVERRLREVEASACRCQEEGRNGCNCAQAANEPDSAGLQRELARMWQSIQQLETTACHCNGQGSGGCGCSGEAANGEAMEILKGEITLIWETIDRMRANECHCDEQGRGGCGCSERDIDDAVYRAVNAQIAGIRETFRVTFEQLDELSEDLVNVAQSGRQALDEAINHIEELEDENNIRRIEAQDMLERITMLEERMDGLAVAPAGVPPAPRPEGPGLYRVLDATPAHEDRRPRAGVITTAHPDPRSQAEVFTTAHADPRPPRAGVITTAHPTTAHPDPFVGYPPSMVTPAGPSQAPQTPVQSEGSFKSEGSSPAFKSEGSSPSFFKSEGSSPSFKSEGSSPPFQGEGPRMRETPGGPDRTRHTGNRWTPYSSGAPPSPGRPQHGSALRSPRPVSPRHPPEPSNLIVCGVGAPRMLAALGSPISISRQPNEPGSGSVPSNRASSREPSSHSESDSSSPNSSSNSSPDGSLGRLNQMESSTGSLNSNESSSDSFNGSSDGSYVPSSGSSSDGSDVPSSGSSSN